MRREPSDAAVLAARIVLAYPASIGSAYRAAWLAESMCAIERAQRRHCERDCSDSGYQGKPYERAERSIAKRISAWLRDLAGDDLATFRLPVVSLQGDPRGAVLLLQFPGEREAKSV